MQDKVVDPRCGELNFYLVVVLHFVHVHFPHGYDKLCVIHAPWVVTDAVLDPNEFATGSGFRGHLDSLVLCGQNGLERSKN
jgi:hypothetical protein